MATNTNASDSDDLEDLDYGDDDFDLESRTEHSQTSGARNSTQDIDDEDEQQEEEEDEDQEDEDANEDKEDDGQDETSDNNLLNENYKLHPRKVGSFRPRRHNQEEPIGRGQKRKHRADEEEEEEEEQNCDQSKNGDKSNVERCKFWPYCTAGDECSFYHPTKPCRTFPNCRFGSNCLYIHPPCKFLPFCTRSDCPFAHPAKQTSAIRSRALIGGGRPPIPMTSQFRPPAVQQPAVPKCKFGFKCSNLMCKFSHQATEPCRYGTNCLLENCAFAHPTDQQSQQQKKSSNVFKWTAKS